VAKCVPPPKRSLADRNQIRTYTEPGSACSSRMCPVLSSHSHGHVQKSLHLCYHHLHYTVFLGILLYTDQGSSLFHTLAPPETPTLLHRETSLYCLYWLYPLAHDHSDKTFGITPKGKQIPLRSTQIYTEPGMACSSTPPSIFLPRQNLWHISQRQTESNCKVHLN